MEDTVKTRETETEELERSLDERINAILAKMNILEADVKECQERTYECTLLPEDRDCGEYSRTFQTKLSKISDLCSVNFDIRKTGCKGCGFEKSEIERRKQLPLVERGGKRCKVIQTG